MKLMLLLRRRIGLMLAATLLAAIMASAFESPAFAWEQQQCPQSASDPTGKMTICHRTGSTTNPFVVISPSCHANGHEPFDHSVGNGFGGDVLLSGTPC